MSCLDDNWCTKEFFKKHILNGSVYVIEIIYSDIAFNFTSVFFLYMLFYACFTQFLLDLYSIDPEYLHIVYNYIFIPSAIVRWLYHWLTLSLFLCLPWCWYIINISVMLRHSAGWFIAYFCVSACSLIVPLHLSLWLSLSYLMCLHTPGLSPSPCPSVPLCLVWLPGCCVYRSWLIIFVSVSTCPLLPDLLQHLPLASIETFCHT